MFAGTVPYYDALYAWKDYAKETRALRTLLRRHRAPPRGRLLDVACGTGRHAEHLARTFDVVGLDLSPRMLALARKRCPGVRFVKGDMTSFDLGETFDVVVCLFSSIGYARGLREMRRAVATMARHLAPGGVLVVEPWFSPAEFHPGRPHMNVVDEPDLKICRMNVSRRRGRVSLLDMHHLIGTPAGTRHVFERHRLWMFTPSEYRAALAAAGLRVSHDPRGLMGRGLWVGVKPK